MIERWIVETFDDEREEWRTEEASDDEGHCRALASLTGARRKVRLLRVTGEVIPLGPTTEQRLEGLQEQQNKLQRDLGDLRAQIKRLFGEGQPFKLRCPVCAGTGSILDAQIGKACFVGCSICSGKGEVPLLLPASLGGFV